MSYREFQPQLTSHAVKCFWILEEDQEGYNSDEILPDSYVDLVVNFGAPLILADESLSEAEASPIFVKGLIRQPLRPRATGFVQLVGVRLYPWAAAALRDGQSDEVSRLRSARDGLARELVRALEVGARRSDFTEAVAALQEIVQHGLLADQSDNTPIQKAIEVLYATHGTSRMADVAAQTYLSLRQFERRFKRATGVSPKTLARLIRFEAIRNQLIATPLTAQSDLAYGFGYTDQAHFVRDFRALASRTPGTFAAAAAQQQYAEFLQYP